MVLTILAVLPVLAVLLVMAAQPLFELWDARASERGAAQLGAQVPLPDDAVPAPAVGRAHRVPGGARRRRRPAADPGAAPPAHPGRPERRPGLRACLEMVGVSGWSTRLGCSIVVGMQERPRRYPSDTSDARGW
ncbi:hypothetical protein [Pseudonocardia sp. ICBG601]|uniref:hypothetical protein n=1 Tax=Pseudonocardia sp. ICBG601 TaxID=2846759 RepID=UPI001CF6F8F7|nr:hypothetical protein [Pseudonocardia sp. ICBG601]